MHFKMIKQNFSKFILINLINFNSWFSLGFEKFCFPCEMSLPIETVFTILARLIPSIQQWFSISIAQGPSAPGNQCTQKWRKLA